MYMSDFNSRVYLNASYGEGGTCMIQNHTRAIISDTQVARIQSVVMRKSLQSDGVFLS